MIKYINEITREYGIEHHTLRNWEDKGFLGVVEKDFTHGRMYSEDQIRRIESIQKVVMNQQSKGMKRTDFKEVERVLLDEFGGMVEVKPSNIAATPETFTNLLLKLEKQDEQMRALQQMVLDLTQITKELPVPVDPSSEIQALREQTEGVMTKDQANQLLAKLTEEEKSKNEMKQEMDLLKSKLDIAVAYIQKEEAAEKRPPNGFWRRIFG